MKLLWAAGGVLCTFTLHHDVCLSREATRHGSSSRLAFRSYGSCSGPCSFICQKGSAGPFTIRHSSSATGTNFLWSFKKRVRPLTSALSTYQMHVHPRRFHSYREDTQPTTILSDISSAFPLPPTAQPQSTINLSIVSIAGDTFLSSVACMLGSKLTKTDLYNCCLVTFKTAKGSITIPSGTRSIRASVRAGVRPGVWQRHTLLAPRRLQHRP